MDAIESMVGRLVAQEESYSPSDTSSARAITEGNTIRITDDHTACSNWDSSTTSTVRGTIDTNIDIISWQWDVADEKSVGWFHPFCNTVSFELITMNVRNITERESCTIVQDNNYASGDITQTCNCGLDDGDLLSWRVDTNYESNSSEDTSGNDDWRGLHRVA